MQEMGITIMLAGYNGWLDKGYKGKDIDFKLTNPESGFFEMEAYPPFFREHCKTCGSRMTCNGCSNCRNCDKK